VIHHNHPSQVRKYHLDLIVFWNFHYYYLILIRRIFLNRISLTNLYYHRAGLESPHHAFYRIRNTPRKLHHSKMSFCLYRVSCQLNTHLKQQQKKTKDIENQLDFFHNFLNFLHHTKSNILRN